MIRHYRSSERAAFRAAFTAVAGLALFALKPAAAQAASLIVNGSFEGGSTAPWATTGQISSSVGTFGAAPDGTRGALIRFGTFTGAATGVFSQSFMVTAPSVYDISFFIGRGETLGGANSSASFRALVNGSLLSEQVPSFSGSSIFGTIFNPYSGSLSLSAGVNTLSFKFGRGATGFSRNVYFALDDVKVLAAPGQPGGGVVPEPATWAMLIAGFGLVGTVARRRRAAVIAA